MKKKYYIILNALIVNATIVAQITFPGEPTQAPIGGLGLLALGGAAIAYKRLRKK